MSSSAEHVPLEWLGSIAEVLDDLGVAWVLAADRYRAGPRYTADLDLLVAWDDRLPGAMAAMGHEVRWYSTTATIRSILGGRAGISRAKGSPRRRPPTARGSPGRR